MTTPPIDLRLGGTADIDAATETVTLAFLDDPVWRVALGRQDGRVEHHAAYWRLFVTASAAQGGLWLVGDAAAVAVWVPPGGAELPPSDVSALERYNLEWLGADGAREISELYERFDSNHPTTEPHAYLGLLATHPDHRGRGIGQMLLAQNLARWDALAVPAYLESTNPANDHRYERAGFRRAGAFTAVRDDAPISTMWRKIGGGSP